MKTKTWPYGTKRGGVVKKANWRPPGLPAEAAPGWLIQDELNEMHICIGGAADSSLKTEGTERAYERTD